MGDGWTLSGSNDGSSWAVIYTGKGDDYGTTNREYYFIDISTDKAYSHYKLYAGSGMDEDNIQLSEIVLCEAALVTKNGEGKRVDSTLPGIDGSIDAVWANADEYHLSILKVGESTGVDGYFKVLWNPSTLYVLVVAPDLTPNHDAVDNYKKDGIEVAIDFPNTKSDTYEEDHQININFFANSDPFNFGTTGIWDDSMITWAINASSGYIYEVAYQCDKAGLTLQDDMVIGMDIQINDNASGEGERDSCYAWNDDADQVWQNPSYMGNMKLLGADTLDIERIKDEFSRLLEEYITTPGNKLTRNAIITLLLEAMTNLS
jgi:hypothetical protein